MKEWSSSWIRSKNPRKQRKYVYCAPLHILRKLISVRLNKDLKTKYGKRNIPVRKGDQIKIMTGDFKGKVGKVNKVSLRLQKVYVDGIFRLNKKGNKLTVGLHPSNLMILELNLEDKLRRKILDRK
jgi:large subunit ribosomal protein L24